MKTKITRKELKNRYKNIIPVYYCSMQFLLKYESEKYYLSNNVDGWQADVYEINNNTVIVTGYTVFGNIKPDRELIRKYENKAMQQSNKYYMKSYNIKKAYRKRLLNNLINKILAQREV